jgi:hypothetical protein
MAVTPDGPPAVHNYSNSDMFHGKTKPSLAAGAGTDRIVSESNTLFVEIRHGALRCAAAARGRILGPESTSLAIESVVLVLIRFRTI